LIIELRDGKTWLNFLLLSYGNDAIFVDDMDSKGKGFLESIVLAVITVRTNVPFVHGRNVTDFALVALYDDAVLAV